MVSRATWTGPVGRRGCRGISPHADVPSRACRPALSAGTGSHVSARLRLIVEGSSLRRRRRRLGAVTPRASRSRDSGRLRNVRRDATVAPRVRGPFSLRLFPGTWRPQGVGDEEFHKYPSRRVQYPHLAGPDIAGTSSLSYPEDSREGHVTNLKYCARECKVHVCES